MIKQKRGIGMKPIDLWFKVELKCDRVIIGLVGMCTELIMRSCSLWTVCSALCWSFQYSIDYK